MTEPFDWTQLTFVVLRHVKKAVHQNFWKRCVWSINQYHAACTVIVIDDHSTIVIEPHSSWADQALKFTLIDSNLAPGHGELLPYYYFLKEQWSKWMITLHDSMFLVRPLEPNLIKTASLWYFNGDPWHQHNETIQMLRMLNNHAELIKTYRNKDQWRACFGAASLIELADLQNLATKYNFPQALVGKIRNRDARTVLERVLGLLIIDNLFGSVLKLPALWQAMSMETYERAHLRPNLHKVPPIVKQWANR